MHCLALGRVGEDRFERRLEVSAQPVDGPGSGQGAKLPLPAIEVVGDDRCEVGIREGASQAALCPAPDRSGERVQCCGGRPGRRGRQCECRDAADQAPQVGSGQGKQAGCGEFSLDGQGGAAETRDSFPVILGRRQLRGSPESSADLAGHQGDGTPERLAQRLMEAGVRGDGEAQPVGSGAGCRGNGRTDRHEQGAARFDPGRMAERPREFEGPDQYVGSRGFPFEDAGVEREGIAPGFGFVRQQVSEP